MGCTAKKKRMILFILLLLTASIPVFGQDSLNVSMLGSHYDFWRYALDVDIEGNYAYVSTYKSGLRIIDVSDNANPEEIGSWFEDYLVNQTHVNGNYAYVAGSSDGLLIVDISNPLATTLVGSANVEMMAEHVFYNDGYVYMAAGNQQLIVVDVSTPSSPQIVAVESGGTAAIDVIVSGNLAYVLCDDGSILIYDVTTPSNPVEIGTYSHQGVSAIGFCLDGDYLYVAALDGGIMIVNVSTPSSPMFVDLYATDGAAWSISVFDGTAYVADGENGLLILDVTIPVAITQTGSYTSLNSFYNDVIVANDCCYVADNYFGLRIFDVSNPASPSETAQFGNVANLLKTTVSGDYAYVIDNKHLNGVLRVVDISNPLAMEEVCIYQPSDLPRGIDISGNIGYIAAQDAGILILDFSDPASPVELGSFTSGVNYFIDAEVSNGYLVTVGWDGVTDGFLSVLDVSNPSAVSELGSCSANTYYAISSVRIVGDYAYGLDSDGTITIFDISDPSSPSFCSACMTDQIVMVDGLAIDGSYAYVSGIMGFKIVDISDPFAPIEVNSVFNYNGVSDIKAANNLVYLAGEFYGLRIIDVSDPDSPLEVGYYEALGQVHAVDLVDNTAYVLDRYTLSVLDCSQASAVRESKEVAIPGEFSLTPAYPNPFNPSTTISLTVPRASDVRVEAYTVTGQLASVIAAGSFTAGSYSFTFDGSHLGSGVYFIRAQSDEMQAVRKVLLMK